MTVTLRDDLLVTQSSATSPTSLPFIPGTALRGMVAGLCPPPLLRDIIVDNTVWFAPAFPLCATAGAPVSAIPTPRHWLTNTTGQVVDGRDISGVRTTLRAGVGATPPLVAVDGHTAYPVALSHRVQSRLARVRDTPASEDGGPFTQAVLPAGLRLATSLWFRSGDPDRDDQLRTRLTERLTAESANHSVRLGAGADGAFGGDLDITLDHRLNAPTPVWATTATEHVDLMLSSPAIVRRGGQTDPTALGAYVVHQINTIVGRDVAHLTPGRPPVIAKISIAGFSRMYRGFRPDTSAADTGSVVTVSIDEPLNAEIWHQICTHRVGERGSDGFGVLSMVGQVARIDTATLAHCLPPLNDTFADGTDVADAITTITAIPPEAATMREEIFTAACTDFLRQSLSRWTVTSPPTPTAVSRLLELSLQGRDAVAAELHHNPARWADLHTCYIDTDTSPAAPLADILQDWVGEERFDDVSERYLSIPGIGGAPPESLLITLAEASLLDSTVGGLQVADARAWLSSHDHDIRDRVLRLLLGVVRTHAQEVP